MENRFATLLSYMAHPLLVPMLGLLIISHSGTYAADIDQHFTHFIYLTVFLLTFLLPAGLIPLLKYSGLVSSIHLPQRKERLIPLYVTLIFYLAAYFLIKKLPVSQVYQRFIFSASVSILLILTISYFWKISAHLAAWGGLVGLILSLSIRFNTDLMLFLVSAILCSGFAGYARLRLGAHNPIQVYFGFLVGFLTVLTIFII
jgi:membrane-associated phospholipid phosphatase